MKTMDNVKKRIITSMIAIVLLIITLFGITYAYFIANLQGNTNNKSVSVTAGKLELIYDDEDSIIIAEKIKPGVTLEEKVFSVKNNGTAKIDNYDVVLEKVVNELKYYEDLTYILTCVSYNTDDYENNGTEATEVGTCNGSEGVFPKYDNTIVTNSIDKGITHYYVLKVTYKETYTDQSEDMNKEVSAKVNIEDNNYNMKKLIIYGNSVQDGTPTSNSPVQIQSVGDKTKNLCSNEHIYYSSYNQYTVEKGEVITSGNTLMGFICEVDPSTTYSASFNILNNTDHIAMRVREYSEYPVEWESDYISQLVNVLYDDTGKKSNSFTTSENTKYIVFGYYTTAETSVNQFIIEESSMVTEYEPFGYKIPLTIRGKNLLNTDALLNDFATKDDNDFILFKVANNPDGTLKERFTNKISISLKAGVKYCMNAELLEYTNNGVIGGQFYSESGKSYTWDRNTYNTNGSLKTFDEDIVAVRYYLDSIDTGYIKLKNLQIEENLCTVYEPYIEPVTINIYLNEPLRKIGNVSDYIDFANNKVIRYVEVIDDTGTLSLNESFRALEIPKEEPIDLPNLKGISSNLNIEVNTSLEPSKIEY